MNDTSEGGAHADEDVGGDSNSWSCECPDCGGTATSTAWEACEGGVVNAYRQTSCEQCGYTEGNVPDDDCMEYDEGQDQLEAERRWVLGHIRKGTATVEVDDHESRYRLLLDGGKRYSRWCDALPLAWIRRFIQVADARFPEFAAAMRAQAMRASMSATTPAAQASEQPAQQHALRVSI